MGQALIAIALVAHLGVLGGVSAAEDLSAADYWQITKARLDLSAQEWQERIVSAEQARGDAKVLNAQSAALSKKYAVLQEQLLREYGTTERAFLHYSTDHAREIASYLEENDDVARVLAGARQVLYALMEQFDTLAKPALERGTAR